MTPSGLQDDTDSTTSTASPAATTEAPTAKPTVDKTADISDGTVFVPAATPGAAVAGTFVGVALFGVAVIAVRDLLVHIGWLDGAEWLHSAADWIADISWWEWMWPAAIGLVVAGLVMLWIAVKPRRRTHISLAGYEVMWTRPGDVARRCSAVVADLPGVENATTVVGRRRARVTVTTRDDAVSRADVVHAVEHVLAGVDRRMTAKVRLTRRRRRSAHNVKGVAA